MIVKYKNFQGELLRYEYLEETDTIIAKIKVEDRVTIDILCKKKELTIPSVMGNYKIVEESTNE